MVPSAERHRCSMNDPVTSGCRILHSPRCHFESERVQRWETSPNMVIMMMLYGDTFGCGPPPVGADRAVLSAASETRRVARYQLQHPHFLLNAHLTPRCSCGWSYSGAKKKFSQPSIVQVVPLEKIREACNFHHRYASTMSYKMRKKNQKNIV